MVDTCDSTSSMAAPTFRKVLQTLRNYAPEYLAADWDNVGLLVEPSGTNVTNRIMVTNDLTTSVVNEAIQTRTNLIISYHPPIFKPLKRLTHKSWKETLIIRCIEEGISVYSPHTALDVIQNGTNDFLLAPFDGIKIPIKPIKPNDIQGEGRIMTLSKPLTLEEAVDIIKKYTNIHVLRICLSSTKNIIKKIAVCAGSGASLLENVAADLYITGEMSHHEVLHATECGTNVICLDHSRSERQFLKEKYVPDLIKLLPNCSVVMSDSDDEPFRLI